MRTIKASTLLILLWSAQQLFAGLAIDLDHACYRGRDSLMYVEVYASIQRSQLPYARTDTAFVAEFQLALELLLRGETDYPGDEWHKDNLTAAIEKLQSLYQEKLDLLSTLQPDEWSKTARHKTLGIRTFQWWVERSWYHAAWHLTKFNMHGCGK